MTLSLENTTKFGQRMPKKLPNSLGETYGYIINRVYIAILSNLVDSPVLTLQTEPSTKEVVSHLEDKVSILATGD